MREAVAAAQLAGKSRLALKLGLEPPRGEALAVEAAYPRVFQSVLLAALELGDAELIAYLSRRAHDELEDGFVRRWCIAILEDQRSPSEGAHVESGERTALWQDALQAATDDDERRQALQGLAFAGASDLPDVDRLVEAWQAAEWRARAAILRGEPQEAVRLVHPHRLASPSASDALADAYRAMGETDAAAEVLIEAARAFDHDRLRIVAAHTYLQANRLPEAEAVLDECVRTAATSWSQRGEALRLLGDLQANRGAWAEATDTWAAALEADTSSVDARWRLAEGLTRRGSLDAAWQALTDRPDQPEGQRQPPPPRQARDVYLATFLAVRLADPHWAVEQALAWLDEFGEDEAITGKVLTLLVAAGGLDRRWTQDHPSAAAQPATTPLPPDLQLRLTAAVDAFCDAHPDSQHLLRFQGSVDHLIDEVNRVGRPTQARANFLRKLLLQVLRGEIPLGVLAAAAPRPYAQVVVTHDGGVLSARGDDVEHEQCVATALDAMGVRIPDSASDQRILPGRAIPTGPAVLDATALFGLTALPDELRDRCVGSLGSLILADEAYVDLRAARDALALDSPGTWTVDPDTGQGHLIPLSPALLERQRERMQAMWRLAEACVRRPTPGDGPPELAAVASEQFAASLAGIRIAVTSSAVVWSDDVALRQLARHFGAAAFSTLALLEAHAALGSLNPADIESTIRCFMKEGLGDFAPIAERLVSLASDSPGRAAVMSATSKPRFWADPTAAIAPLLTLIDVVSDSPHDVHDLVHCSTLGVARTYLPDGLVEATIAAIVAKALLMVGPAGHAPRLLAAVRAAIHEGRRPLEDPLGSAANLVIETLQASLGPQLAADSVRGFVANCSDDDRSVVARVILQPLRPLPEG